MGRIHPVSKEVAFTDAGRAFEAAWFGNDQVYQDARDIRVRVKPDGKVVPIEPQMGALAVRAGRFTWHTRLDTPGPTLSSSIAAMNGVAGFEGADAADADLSVTLDLGKVTARVWTSAGWVKDVPLPGGVAGEPWVDQTGRWLMATCFVAGAKKFTLVDLVTGATTFPTCLTPAGQWGPAGVMIGGVLWVVYGTDEFGLVIHPETDRTRRLILAPPPGPDGSGAYGVDVCLIDGTVEIIWFTFPSQFRRELQRASLPVADLNALPSVPVIVPPPPPPPAPVLPNGPMGPAEPVGTVVNVAADFFALDSRAWPRGNKAKGDTHGMDYQAVTHYGEACLWECKFDTDGRGRLGELLSIDMGPDGQPDPKGYIHWRADCSDAGDPGALNPDGTVKRPPREAFVDVPGDTRWLRNVMQVGRQFGLDVGDHILRKVRRRDGTLIREVGFNRETWIEALWRRYWMNPWGEVELLVYAYNNTGFRAGKGNGDPATWVERYWQARKRMPDGSWLVIAWGDWGSDQSSVVFAGGGTAFPNPPGVRSSFWHLGGQRFAPDLPPFRMPIAVPPVVLPPPVPPVEVPVTADQIATVLAGAFFDRICKHLGLPTGDGTQDAARPKVFTWILSKVRLIDDGYFAVFKRRCLGTPGDLEAFGSRVEWLLATKGTDAQFLKMLQDAYDRGDR